MGTEQIWKELLTKKYFTKRHTQELFHEFYN